MPVLYQGIRFYYAELIALWIAHDDMAPGDGIGDIGAKTFSSRDLDMVVATAILAAQQDARRTEFRLASRNRDIERVMPSATQLSVHLLGGFRVIAGERAIHSFPPRQTSLLAYLALAPAYRLHREWLMDALWSDLDLDAQTNNLNVTIHATRKRLVSAGVPSGVFLIREGEMVVLGPADALSVDVVAFDEAIARAWQDVDPAITQAACDLYVGDLVPELPYDSQLDARRTTLRASVAAIFTRLGSQYAERGQIDAALAAFTRLATFEPTHEDAHGALMRLYAMSGQRQAALDQYDTLVRQLASVLDVEPQASTIALADAIRSGEFPETIPSLVPHRVITAVSVESGTGSTVPTPLTDLIGREREIAEVTQLLAARRLVTLTGPGGVGKTRLSIAVGHAMVDAFEDGVVFVDLAPLRDPTLVLPTIAATLGIRESGERAHSDVLVTALRSHQYLLILDNVEQVIEAAREISGLISACPSLSVLATSRAPLHIRGEAEYPVTPLPLPPSDHAIAIERLRASPTVALFVERARAGKPGFDLSAENAGSVVAICQRLDGLPLAIELAAARIRLMSPEALVERLKHPLRVLTGGARDLPDRQRTIRDTIRWSYDLLSEAEQRLFRRLSVFVGGWTLDAADAVCESSDRVVDGIGALLDASLIVSTDSSDGSARFTMLETIREYALEQQQAAGVTEQLRKRHAGCFLALAETLWASAEFSDAVGVFRALKQDQENLRTALDWFRESNATEHGLRMCAALGHYWLERGAPGEGWSWIAHFLERADPSVPAGIRAWVLIRGGWLVLFSGDSDGAQVLAAEALLLAESNGLHEVDALAALIYAIARKRLGDEGGAYTSYARSIASARLANDTSTLARALMSLGSMHVNSGQHHEAAQMLAESLDLAREHRYDDIAAWTLMNQGDLAQRIGEYAESVQLLHEALRIALDRGIPLLVADTIDLIAEVAVRRGAVDRAARLLGVVESIRSRIGVPRAADTLVVFAAMVESVRAAMGDDQMRAAWRAGAMLTPEQGISVALDIDEGDAQRCE